jgi:hypothetical protein
MFIRHDVNSDESTELILIPLTAETARKTEHINILHEPQ